MLIRPDAFNFDPLDAVPARAAIYALERRYLDRLDWSRAQLSRQRAPLDWQMDARFVQLDRLGQAAHGTVSQNPANLLRLGMQSLLATMHRSSGALIFALGSDGGAQASHSLTLGVRADRGSAAGQLAALTGALAGNFPGSRWSPIPPAVAELALTAPLRDWSHLGALTGLPSFKRDDQQEAQG